MAIQIKVPHLWHFSEQLARTEKGPFWCTNLMQLNNRLDKITLLEEMMCATYEDRIQKAYLKYLINVVMM